MKSKRLLSLLLAVVMLIGLIPAATVSAAAAEMIVAKSPTKLADYLLTTGDSTITLEPGYAPEYIWKKEMPSFVVRGNKVLDLNGVNLEKQIYNDSLAEKSVMFTIEKGASLTIIDSKGGGGISTISPNLLDTKQDFKAKPPVRESVSGGRRYSDHQRRNLYCRQFRGFLGHLGRRIRFPQRNLLRKYPLSEYRQRGYGEKTVVPS